MAGGLSDRLQVIADQVTPGGCTADIGTDHGYIPIYLISEGIADKVIMTDVSPGSLDKAKYNVRERLPDANGIEARLGDGLDPLAAGECGTVVIAGMGGLLIRDILDWDLKKTKTFSNFVLQPRTKAGALRKWLLQNGFEIEKDLLAREGKRVSEIIKAAPRKDGGSAGAGGDEMAFVYPDDLADPFGGDLVCAYLCGELRKYRAILAQIEENDGPDRVKEPIRKRIGRLEDLCGKKNCSV